MAPPGTVKVCGACVGRRTAESSVTTCPTCSGRICTACGNSTRTCGTHDCCSSNAPKSPDAFDGLVRGRDYQLCPGCSTRIELRDGCNHMTCEHGTCRTQFCYICGQPAAENSGHWPAPSTCPRYGLPGAPNAFQDPAEAAAAAAAVAFEAMAEQLLQEAELAFRREQQEREHERDILLAQANVEMDHRRAASRRNAAALHQLYIDVLRDNRAEAMAAGQALPEAEELARIFADGILLATLEPLTRLLAVNLRDRERDLTVIVEGRPLIETFRERHAELEEIAVAMTDHFWQRFPLLTVSYAEYRAWAIATL